jgi:hypothetical protein
MTLEQQNEVLHQALFTLIHAIEHDKWTNTEESYNLLDEAYKVAKKQESKIRKSNENKTK